MKKSEFPARYYYGLLLVRKLQKFFGKMRMMKKGSKLDVSLFVVHYRLVLSVLKKDFKEVISKYAAKGKGSAGSIKTILREEDSDIQRFGGTIWTCWWQGEEEAPLLVKRCIESIRRNAAGHEVIVIDHNNMNDYIELPAHITLKHEAKQITTTHFSDFIRLALLTKYGGLWLDATVYSYREIPEELWSIPIFSGKHYGKYTSLTSLRPKLLTNKYFFWETGILGGCKNHPIFHFTWDMLIRYWKVYSSLIEYWLISYVMTLAYHTVPIVKRDTDAMPINADDCLKLSWVFDESKAYDQNEIDELAKNGTVFFKLSWKDKYEEYTDTGEETLYKKFIDGKLADEKPT